jgi:hypothetical protein
MAMNYNSLSLLTIAVIFLSSCSPLKPDHPQQFSSFKDRRPPRDNQLISNGPQAADAKDFKKTGFIPYSGAEPKEDTSDSASSKASDTVGGIKSQITDSIDSVKKDDSGDSETFFQKLIKKFSSNKVNKSINVATTNGSSNGYNSISEDYAGLGQGSGYGVNYYDMADNIVKAAPVRYIEQTSLDAHVIKASYPEQPKLIQPDNNNPSAPLIDIPQIPTQEDLKHKSGQNQQKPELSNIPPKPKEFEQPVEKPMQGKNTATPEVVIDKQPFIQVEKDETTPKVSIPEKDEGVKAPKDKEVNNKKTGSKKADSKRIKKTVNKKDIHKAKDSEYNENHLTAYNYKESNTGYKDAIIKDKAAKLEYQNGHHIVTGELKCNTVN